MIVDQIFIWFIFITSPAPDNEVRAVWPDYPAEIRNLIAYIFQSLVLRRQIYYHRFSGVVPRGHKWFPILCGMATDPQHWSSICLRSSNQEAVVELIVTADSWHHLEHSEAATVSLVWALIFLLSTVFTLDEGRNCMSACHCIFKEFQATEITNKD